VLTIAEFGKALDLYARAGPITERTAGAKQQDLATLFEDQGRLLPRIATTRPRTRSSGR
jgi:hypothetical protein